MIVARHTPERLSEDVEELLNSGWRLHGNLILTSHSEPPDESGWSRTRTIYLQAILNDQDPLGNLAFAEEDFVETFA
jgi:hypothetical protein